MVIDEYLLYLLLWIVKGIVSLRYRLEIIGLDKISDHCERSV